MLADARDTDDNTMGSLDLRYQLYDASMQLIIRCLRFDSKVSVGEESSEIHPIVTLPNKWLTDILQGKIILLLFSVYDQCNDPLTTTALQVILWFFYSPRTVLYTANSEVGLFLTLLKGLSAIFASKHGLDNPDTVHVISQIVDQFKVVIPLISHVVCV